MGGKWQAGICLLSYAWTSFVCVNEQKKEWLSSEFSDPKDCWFNIFRASALS